MKIAVIGWGSLIWSKRDLEIKGDWVIGGGPVLPLEFSRISTDGRLTLVIDLTNGLEVTTRYAISSFGDLDAAINNLRLREGAVSAKAIGYINLKDGSGRARNPNDLEDIRSWATRVNMDAVIWSDFRPNFEEKAGSKFSVDNAMEYLTNLNTPAREKAFEYIRKAPTEVDTPLRRRFSDWVHTP